MMPQAAAGTQASDEGSSSRPTFVFGIGAQKAGTTWLYSYFKQHPQVHVPRIKEVHYFDTIWLGATERKDRRLSRFQRLEHKIETRRSLGLKVSPEAEQRLERARAVTSIYNPADEDFSQYEDFVMKGRTSEPCVAEITPAYSGLRLEHFTTMLDRFAPAKFVFILRDPVDRMWSQIRMHCAKGEGSDAPPTPDGVIEKLLQGKAVVFRQRGAMDVTLSVLAKLPQDRVKVLFYETMFQDDTIRDLCDFLDVEFHAGEYETRVNKGEAMEMTPQQRATLRWLNGPTYQAIQAQIGGSIPAAWDMGAVDAPRPDFLSVSEINEQILQGRMT